MKIANKYRRTLILPLLALGLCQGLPAQAGLIAIEGQGSGPFEVPNSLEFTALVDDNVSDSDSDENFGFYAGALTNFDFVLSPDGFSPISANGLTGDVTVSLNELGLFDYLRLVTVSGEVGFYGSPGTFGSDSLLDALAVGLAGGFSELFYVTYSSPEFRGSGTPEDFSFSAQDVPLPATASMLTLGLALLFGWRRPRTVSIHQ